MNVLIAILVLLPLVGFASLLAVEDELLTPGSEAPLFSLRDQDGHTVSLEDYKGKKYVVLVFYPGDNTPGCTKQLCELRDDYASLTDRNAVVLGINPGSERSHKKFAEKYGYNFSLLVDASKEVIAAYGCKGMVMVKRTVYVIDPEGRIVLAERGKPPVKDILAVIPRK